MTGGRSEWLADLRRLREDCEFGKLEAAIRTSPFAGTPLAELHLARTHLAGHQPEQALAALERLLAAQPDFDPAAAWTIVALERLYRVADATAAAERLRTRFPRSIPVHLAVARHYWAALDDDPRALEVLSAARLLDPADPDVLRWRARILGTDGRHDEAEAAARELTAAHPELPDAHAVLGKVLMSAGRPAPALDAADEALRLDSDHIDGWLLRLEALEELRRWADSDRTAAEAVAARPRSVEIRIRIGRVLSAQDRDEEALAAFEDALAIDPADEFARSARIDALRWLRRWDEAETAARLLIEARPGDPQSHLTLGWVHYFQDRDEEALAAFRQAVALTPHSFDALGAEVDALRRLRRWEQAETAARRLIAAHPRDPQSQVNLGWVLHSQNRHEESLSAYEDALSVDPQHATALRWKTNALRALRRWDQAEATAHRLIETAPNDPQSHLHLGWVHYDQDLDEEALAAFEDALAVDPDHAAARRARIEALRALRRWADAEAAARELVGIHPRDPQSHVSLAWVHDDQDQDEEALSAYRDALALDPRHTAALRGVVDSLRWLHREDEAEEAARRLVGIHPDDPRSHISLGWVHDDQGRYEKALSAFEDALAVDPLQPTALHWKTKALRALRRWDQAEAAARQLIEVAPGDPQAQVTLAWVYDDQDRDEEALAAYEQALALDPRHTGALRGRVDSLRWLRRWEDAEAAARRLIAAHPRDPQSQVNLGWVLADQGREEEALTAYRKALAIDPRQLPALRWTVNALRGLRRWEEAEATARKLVAAHPRHPQAHLALGWIHYDRDRDEEALAAFEDALAADPRFPEALGARVDALRALRRWQQAESAARQRIRTRPGDPQSLVSLGWVFADQGREEEALAAYQDALAIDPRHRIALRARADALRVLRRWQEAERAARELIRAHPRDPLSYVRLGWVFFYQDREEEALAAHENALAVDPTNTVALRARVDCLRWLRRWGEAESAARGLIEDRPHDPQSHVNLAWALADQERLDEALAAYQDALERDPRSAAALRGRVSVLSRQRRWAEAEEAARAALRTRPDEAASPLTLGAVLEGRERYDQALDSAEAACRLDPSSWEARAQRVRMLLKLLRFDEAEQAARGFLTEAPGRLDPHLILGYVLAAQHRWAEALALCESADAIDPHDSDLVLSRSMALRSLHCFTEAENRVSAAVARNPLAPDLRVELAWIHLDRRDPAGADRHFARLLEEAAGPLERARAHWGRGWAAMTAGRFADAEEQFRQAVRLVPDDPEPSLGLAWALLRIGGRAEEAEGLCRRVLELSPTSHGAHTCLGMLAYQRGRLPEAERHFRRSAELDPYDGCHVDLGALCIQLGRFEEAEAALRRAVELDPWNAEAHVKLGMLQLQRTESDPSAGGDGGPAQLARSAVGEFRKALAVDPHHTGASIGLAVALATAPGDLIAAENVLRRAIAQRQDDQQPGDQNRWQLHLSLARLLIQSGDVDHSTELYDSAAQEAVLAVRLAAEQAECHFVAGVAEQRLAAHSGDLRQKLVHRQHAQRHFKKSQSLGGGEVQADTAHALRLLDQQTRTARAGAARGGALVVLSSAVLVAMWVDFLWKHHSSTVMVTTLTPVLVGLVAIGLLLPVLIRLKLPGGMEADLSASLELLSADPTGNLKITPRHYPTLARPTGQPPRFQHPANS